MTRDHEGDVPERHDDARASDDVRASDDRDVVPMPGDQPEGGPPGLEVVEGTHEGTDDDAPGLPEHSDGGSPDAATDADDPRSREELLTALREAESARDEYLDHLKRSQAEFANFRKRTMREGASQRDAGVQEVLMRLMDVVDEFELAILAAERAADVASLRKGVELVYGKLVDVLKGLNLEKVGAEGAPFDPAVHEAVQQEDDDDSPRNEPVVAEVLRPGYVVGDRVLRPAMVRVVR